MNKRDIRNKIIPIIEAIFESYIDDETKEYYIGIRNRQISTLWVNEDQPHIITTSRAEVLTFIERWVKEDLIKFGRVLLYSCRDNALISFDTDETVDPYDEDEDPYDEDEDPYEYAEMDNLSGSIPDNIFYILND